MVQLDVFTTLICLPTSCYARPEAASRPFACDRLGPCLQTRALQQAVQPGTRFVLVTATLPEPVWLDMQAIFPDIRMAKYAKACSFC